MAEQAFKFPDEGENNQEKNAELMVEVVDDTPEADRNRVPMPKNIVEELEKDEDERNPDWG